MTSDIMQPNHTCPVCGYRGLSSAPYSKFPTLPMSDDLLPPYSQYFGDPSYEVCDCCGFEFGNDDEPGTAGPTSFRAYRHEWLEDGGQWFSPSKRPPDWSLERQLRDAHLM
jgi:rubredoxin